jgi:hypothetical protein
MVPGQRAAAAASAPSPPLPLGSSERDRRPASLGGARVSLWVHGRRSRGAAAAGGGSRCGESARVKSKRLPRRQGPPLGASCRVARAKSYIRELASFSNKARAFEATRDVEQANMLAAR